MRFLLNMNVPRELGRRLESFGHEARHVAGIDMSRSSDAAIVVEAREHQETILTHDLDYGHLLAFSGAAAPSVIIFRVRNSRAESLLARVMSAWDEIGDALSLGAIVVVEDGAVRIRRLPIRAGQ